MTGLEFFQRIGKIANSSRPFVMPDSDRPQYDHIPIPLFKMSSFRWLSAKQRAELDVWGQKIIDNGEFMWNSGESAAVGQALLYAAFNPPNGGVSEGGGA